MAKKHYLALAILGLRNRFHSLIAILVAVFVVVTIYIAGKSTWLFKDLIITTRTGYSDSLSRCDLFSGKWVFDNSTYPLYSEKQCSFMSDQLACEKFGRKDLSYQNWRWQPNQCDLPRWGSFGSPNGMYKEIEMLRSYEMALKTWSDWLEIHVNHTKTQLFFVSMSPTHFWADEWGMAKEGNCYNETKPITEDGYRGRGSDQKMMRVVKTAIDELKTKGVNVKILNITQLSEYRKEGHPSIYRKQWEPLTQDQILNPSSYSDCIHWCLPGVPDAWNELLYAYIFS